MDALRLINLGDKALVELSEAVENPNSDRRAKYDWRKFPTLPQGTQFLVEHQNAQQTLLWNLPPGPEYDAVVKGLLKRGCPEIDGQIIVGVSLSPIKIPGNRSRAAGTYEVFLRMIETKTDREYPNSVLAHLIAPALVPLKQDTLAKVLAAHRSTEATVLKRLLREGKVTLDDVKEVLE